MPKKNEGVEDGKDLPHELKTPYQLARRFHIAPDQPRRLLKKLGRDRAKLLEAAELL